MKQVKAREDRYRGNISDNLQGSVVFDDADQSVSSLGKAIEIPGSVY